MSGTVRLNVLKRSLPAIFGQLVEVWVTLTAGHP